MPRSREGRRKRRGKVYRAFERVVLGMGMTLMAMVIERRLLKALKKGQVEPAARTAAGTDESTAMANPPTREGELATTSEQIGDQP